MLAKGCAAARREADHPSRIIPIVTRETEEWLRVRARAVVGDRVGRGAFRVPAPDYCTGAEAAAILEEYGLRRRAGE
jgi:hypothetical protein